MTHQKAFRKRKKKGSGAQPGLSYIEFRQCIDAGSSLENTDSGRMA